MRGRNFSSLLDFLMDEYCLPLENMVFVDDIADKLNSDKKKLAYLFLIEYAATLPEIGGDELLADAWAFKRWSALVFSGNDGTVRKKAVRKAS